MKNNNKGCTKRCKQLHKKLRVCSYLPNKFSTENFNFDQFK